MSTDAHIEVVLDYSRGATRVRSSISCAPWTTTSSTTSCPPCTRPSGAAISPTTGGSSRRSTTRLENRPPDWEWRRGRQRVEFRVHVAEHRKSDDVPRLRMVRHEGTPNRRGPRVLRIQRVQGLPTHRIPLQRIVRISKSRPRPPVRCDLSVTGDGTVGVHAHRQVCAQPEGGP